MAITWTNHKDGTTRITNVGCVIEKTTNVVRVMSDVYCDVLYATVWNPEEQRCDTFAVNYYGMDQEEHGSAVVDIHEGGYAEDYEIWLLIQEDIKREQEAIEAEKARIRQLEEDTKDAKEACLEVVKGVRCKVVAGRKVAKGTEGEVFWIRDTHYGTKIGIRDEKGVAHWTYARNVAVLLDGVDVDEWGNVTEPAEGWIAKWDAIYTKRQEAYQAKRAKMTRMDDLMERMGNPSRYY